jgi:ketosteroid isomerase-like protein
MSENIEIAQAFYDGINRRGEIEDVLHYVNPDIELRPGVVAPDANTRYLGRQAFREFFEAVVFGPWERVTIEPKEMIEAADGRILSIELWRFRGRDGIEIERELAEIVTFRSGLISRIDGYADRADALEAAGLSE